MNLKRLFSLLLVLSMLLSLAACGGSSGEEVASDIPNGDFELEHEEGKWTGWTRDGAAFNVRGLVDGDTLNGAVMEKSGTYYFAGCEGGNPAMWGTLTSNVFTLGGNGFITFKMGAGKWDCTTYSYDVAQAIITGKTANKGEGASTSVTSGALSLEDGKLTMEIYVDRSLVEAFFNDSKSLSIRAYTEEEDSYGIDLFAEGDILIEELYVASMGSIFE